MALIKRKDYPALDYILWDNKILELSAEMAFHLYEKRWKFIDQDMLLTKEKTLINTLIEKVGKGFFLPA